MSLLINNMHEKISIWLGRKNARVSHNQGKLRHPGRALDLKTKDLIGHMSFLDNWPIRMLSLLPFFCIEY